MNLTPLITRLRAECPALRQVIHALASQPPASYPAAYVLLLSEKAQPNPVFGGHRQRITATFMVELMVKHAAQAGSGGPAAEALDAVRESVLHALIGWPPSPAHDPIDYTGGRLLQFEAGIAIWRDEFTTQFYKELMP